MSSVDRFPFKVADFDHCPDPFRDSLRRAVTPTDNISAIIYSPAFVSGKVSLPGSVSRARGFPASSFRSGGAFGSLSWRLKQHAEARNFRFSSRQKTKRRSQDSCVRHFHVVDQGRLPCLRTIPKFGGDGAPPSQGQSG